MRILISSGGTTVPIDPVRNITNSSSGRFGAELAHSALLAGADVLYLVSSHGQSPFSCQLDLYDVQKRARAISQVETLLGFVEQYAAHYREYRYHHFHDYATLLKTMIEKEQPDVVILAAAVSDYLVSHYSHEKVRSSLALNLQLEPAPKLINAVKQWAPNTFLVGFKLLIDASDAELVKTAVSGMQQHQADLVVANNLASLKRGRHEVILVERNGSFQKYSEHLADNIIARALLRSVA